MIMPERLMPLVVDAFCNILVEPPRQGCTADEMEAQESFALLAFTCLTSLHVRAVAADSDDPLDKLRLRILESWREIMRWLTHFRDGRISNSAIVTSRNRYSMAMIFFELFTTYTDFAHLEDIVKCPPDHFLNSPNASSFAIQDWMQNEGDNLEQRASRRSQTTFTLRQFLRCRDSSDELVGQIIQEFGGSAEDVARHALQPLRSAAKLGAIDPTEILPCLDVLTILCSDLRLCMPALQNGATRILGKAFVLLSTDLGVNDVWRAISDCFEFFLYATTVPNGGPWVEHLIRSGFLEGLVNCCHTDTSLSSEILDWFRCLLSDVISCHLSFNSVLNAVVRALERLGSRASLSRMNGGPLAKEWEDFLSFVLQRMVTKCIFLPELDYPMATCSNVLSAFNPGRESRG